jgi:hypothetical protein
MPETVTILPPATAPERGEGKAMTEQQAEKSLCPHCGGELQAAFEEHVEYPVISVESCHVESDMDKGQCYDTELIHITCTGCDTYWYSTHEYLEACEKAEVLT